MKLYHAPSNASFPFHATLRLGLSFLCWLLTTTAWGQIQPQVRSYQPHQFYVEPGVGSVFEWDVRGSLGAKTTLDYQITDVEGHVVQRGMAGLTDDGKLRTRVSLPRGYFKLEFLSIDNEVVGRGGAGQFSLPAQSGIASIPAAVGEPDRFFGLHTELAKQYDTDPFGTQSQRLTMLDSLTRSLRRSGIGSIRDRVRPALLNPDLGVYDWQGTSSNTPNPHYYDDMRRAVEKYDIETMPFFLLAPDWQRRDIDRELYAPGEQQYAFTADLNAATETWVNIHDRWQNTMHAIEVFNEPGGTVEDRLAPLIQAIAYRFDQGNGPRPELGGAGFAGGVPGRLLDALGRTGTLDVMDYLSFHTYANPQNLEGLVQQYRSHLDEYGRGNMPLWMTEVGDKFTGDAVPEPLEQRSRASKILGNLIEARAVGVERFFGFLYNPSPWSEDGDQHQFLHADGSPMASMAAMANAATLLGHSEYAGDLEGLAGIERSRVFFLEEQAIITLMTGSQSVMSLDMPFAVERVFGVDGRDLALTRSGEVLLADELNYVIANRSEVMPFLNADTPAMQLYQSAQAGRDQTTAQGRPVVLMHLPDYNRMSSTGNGYTLSGLDASELELEFLVSNLSDAPRTVNLALELPAWLSASQTTRQVVVPAGSATPVRWSVAYDASQPGIFDNIILTSATADASVAPVSLGVVAPRDLQGVLDSFDRVDRIDITDRSRWTIGKDATTQIDFVIENGVARAEYTFSQEKAFSNLALDVTREDLADATGLVAVIRGTAPPEADLRFWPKPRFAVVEAGGGRYEGGGVPADGSIQVAYLPFDSLSINAQGMTDDNQVLDPDQIIELVFGTWHGTPGEPFTLEILDAYVVGQPKFTNPEPTSVAAFLAIGAVILGSRRRIVSRQ